MMSYPLRRNEPHRGQTSRRGGKGQSQFLGRPAAGGVVVDDIDVVGGVVGGIADVPRTKKRVCCDREQSLPHLRAPAGGLQ